MSLDEFDSDGHIPHEATQAISNLLGKTFVASDAEIDAESDTTSVLEAELGTDPEFEECERELADTLKREARAMEDLEARQAEEHEASEQLQRALRWNRHDRLDEMSTRIMNAYEDDIERLQTANNDLIAENADLKNAEAPGSLAYEIESMRKQADRTAKTREKENESWLTKHVLLESQVASTKAKLGDVKKQLSECRKNQQSLVSDKELLQEQYKTLVEEKKLQGKTFGDEKNTWEKRLRESNLAVFEAQRNYVGLQQEAQETLTRVCNEREDYKHQMQAAQVKAERAVEAKQQLASELEHENARWIEKGSASTETIAALQINKLALEKDRSLLEKQKSKLESEMLALQKSISSLQQDNDGMNTKVTELEELATSRQTENEALVNGLLEEQARLQQKVADLEKKARDRHSEHDAIVSSLQAANTGLNDKLTELETNATNHESEHGRIVTALQKEKAALQSKVNNLEGNVATLQSSYDTHVSAREIEKTMLEKDIAELQESARTHQYERETTISFLQEKEKRLENKVSDLEGSAMTHQSEHETALSALRRENSALALKATGLEHSNTDLQTKHNQSIARFQHEHHNLVQKAIGLACVVANLWLELETSVSRAADLAQRLEQQTFVRLYEQEESEERIDDLRCQLGALEFELKEASHQYRDLEIETQQEKSELQRQHGMDLHEQAAEHHSAYTTLQNEMAQLRTEHEETMCATTSEAELSSQQQYETLTKTKQQLSDSIALCNVLRTDVQTLQNSIRVSGSKAAETSEQHGETIKAMQDEIDQVRRDRNEARRKATETENARRLLHTKTEDLGRLNSGLSKNMKRASKAYRKTRTLLQSEIVRLCHEHNANVQSIERCVASTKTLRAELKAARTTLNGLKSNLSHHRVLDYVQRTLYTKAIQDNGAAFESRLRSHELNTEARQNAVADKHKSALDSLRETMQKEIDQAVKSISSLASDLAKQQESSAEELGKKDTEIDLLKKDWSQSNQTSKDELRQLSEQASRVESDLKTQVGNLRKEIDQLGQEKTRLEKKQAQQYATVSRWYNNTLKLEGDLKDIRAQLVAANNRVAELDRQLVTANDRVTELEQQLATANNRITELDRQLVEANQSVDEWKRVNRLIENARRVTIVEMNKLTGHTPIETTHADFQDDFGDDFAAQNARRVARIVASVKATLQKCAENEQLSMDLSSELDSVWRRYDERGNLAQNIITTHEDTIRDLRDLRSRQGTAIRTLRAKLDETEQGWQATKALLGKTQTSVTRLTQFIEQRSAGPSTSK